MRIEALRVRGPYTATALCTVISCPADESRLLDFDLGRSLDECPVYVRGYNSHSLRKFRARGAEQLKVMRPEHDVYALGVMAEAWFGDCTFVRILKAAEKEGDELQEEENEEEEAEDLLSKAIAEAQKYPDQLSRHDSHNEFLNEVLAGGAGSPKAVEWHSKRA